MTLTQMYFVEPHRLSSPVFMPHYQKCQIIRFHTTGGFIILLE